MVEVIKFPFRYRFQGDPKWSYGHTPDLRSEQGDLPKFLMAVTEITVDEHTTYPLFFVNNSGRYIDELVIIRPGVYDEVGDAKTIRDIPEKVFTQHRAAKLEDLPPGTYVREDKFHDWDFDWSNTRKVFIRVKWEDIYLVFYMRKYFICGEKTFINLLATEGWVSETLDNY